MDDRRRGGLAGAPRDDASATARGCWWPPRASSRGACRRDPLLSGFRTIVLDEFHERSIHADLALAFARQAWRARDDLRLLVMSATLDAGPISRFLDDCPVIEVAGSAVPDRGALRAVAPRWPMRFAGCSRGTAATSCASCRARRRSAARRRSSAATVGVPVLPLHGSLPAEEQDRAIAPAAVASCHPRHQRGRDLDHRGGRHGRRRLRPAEGPALRPRACRRSPRARADPGGLGIAARRSRGPHGPGTRAAPLGRARPAAPAARAGDRARGSGRTAARRAGLGRRSGGVRVVRSATRGARAGGAATAGAAGSAAGSPALAGGRGVARAAPAPSTGARPARGRGRSARGEGLCGGRRGLASRLGASRPRRTPTCWPRSTAGATHRPPFGRSPTSCSECSSAAGCGHREARPATRHSCGRYSRAFPTASRGGASRARRVWSWPRAPAPCRRGRAASGTRSCWLPSS